MSYVLYLSLILSGLYKKKSIVIAIFLFFGMWLIFTFNYSNGDYETYKGFYSTRDSLSWGIEVVFGSLSRVFYQSGVSYDFFKSTMAFFFVD